MNSARLAKIETLLARAADRKPEPVDPLLSRAWYEGTEGLIADMRDALNELVSAEGGMLALKLRTLFEESIVKEVNGRTVLTDEVTEHSLQVHVIDEAVIVDVRLRIGKARQDV